MKNELNLFIIFESVIRLGSVVKAAESLDMTPPAVSQAINRLRKKHTDPLFVREGRGLKPTNYALELYDKIQGPLAELIYNLEEQKSFNPLESTRTFRIAANSDIELLFYGELIDLLQKEAPNIKIETKIEFENKEEIKNALRLRKVDLAISMEEIKEMSYNNLKISEENIIALARKDHPRIKNELTLEGFMNEKHISWNQNQNDVNAILKTILPNKIPDRNVVYRCSAMNMMFITSNSDLLCLASERIYEKIQNLNILNKYPLPFDCEPFPLYMSWHKSYNDDEGVIWLKNEILKIIK